MKKYQFQLNDIVRLSEKNLKVYQMSYSFHKICL